MADAADDAVTGNGTTDAVRDEDNDAPVEVIATPTEAVDEPREPDPSTEQRATAAVVPYERPRALIPGVDLPIIPDHREMQGMAQMAVTLAAANAVPVALRNNPNDVFQILLTARDLGVAVTTGMREFHVIEGKVTLSPKVKMAMVNERGAREGWAIWPDPDNSAESATWYATRRDRPGLTFSSTFTMDEAKNVKVKANQTLDQKDNWQNYPRRMLSWRALGYLLDDVFPEVGTGLYSPDELGAMTDEDGQVIDVTVAEPLPGTKAPRNHGPKPPDPNDAMMADADADLHADLKRRLDAITAASADARAALVALWTKQNDEGTPALPPHAHLQVRHANKAKAMVQSIERQLTSGQFGDDAKAAWESLTADDAAPPTVDDAPPATVLCDVWEFCSKTKGHDGRCEDVRGDNPPEPAPAPDPEPEGEGEPVVETGPECEACGAKPGSDHDQRLHDLADAVDDARAATAPKVDPNVALAETIAREVAAMSGVDVTKALTDRSYLPPRSDPAKRKALSVVLYVERGGVGAQPSDLPQRDEEPVPDPAPEAEQQELLGGQDRAAGTD